MGSTSGTMDQLTFDGFDKILSPFSEHENSCPLHDISKDESEHDNEKVEKPFFGNYDIVELESQTKVNRTK